MCIEVNNREQNYLKTFNPIEMVWGDVKGYLGRENNTFKTNDVKDLIIKGFKTITPEKWFNFCNHVENKIEQTTHSLYVHRG
jgi:hypothetical protein